ncbi:MAG: MaoC family dehydratase [Rhodomicrobium sp.]|jgi:3-hydroxybutyryl-CoA dehydratase
MPIDIAPGLYFEDLSAGMNESLAHTVTAEEIEAFARISGDFNPVHLDDAYAAATPFKQRIAHGILTASYISALFGTRLPGPGCIYVSQTLNFKAPVYIGAEVIATVKITDLLPEKRRAIFSCVCKVAGKAVLEGEAVLMVPSRAPKK